MLRSAELAGELAWREIVIRSGRSYGMNGNVLMVIIIVTMIFLFLLVVVTPLVSAA